MTVRILQGHCLDVLATMAPESVHCVVTSPPYWGLRDYQIPPTIWGGDHACDHQWGDELRAADGSGFQGKNGERFDRAGAEQRESHKARGNFCQACGAWRGALGLEPDYRMFVTHMVEVFREVWRVLRPDATLWLNLGDSYATGTSKERKPTECGKHGYWENPNITHRINGAESGLKPKDLCGIPWRVALALQDAGWYLRQDIIWAKPNPMPESVTDRCTKSHEYLFLLAKSETYYFDQEAILEDASANTHARLSQATLAEQHGSDRVPGKTNGPMKAVARMGGGNKSHKGLTAYENGAAEHRTKAGLVDYSQRKMAEAGSGIKNNTSMDAALAVMPLKRNKRSVWTVTTQPFSEAHFATFPPALIEPCILAGCPEGGLVLDPFGGAGTTGLVADRLKRNAVLIELNPSYAEMARKRIVGDAPLLTEVHSHAATEHETASTRSIGDGDAGALQQVEDGGERCAEAS